MNQSGMSNNSDRNNKQSKTEIDILDIIQKLWKGKKTIFWWVGVAAFLGLVVAFSMPKQYKVVTTMLPQSEESSSMGSLSSLAAIAGFDIDLGDNGSEISPIIYPQIMESETFLLDLMHSTFTFKKVKGPISLYDYYRNYADKGVAAAVKKYTIGLPALLKASFNQHKKTTIGTNDGLTRMNEVEYNLAAMLKSSVTLSVNKKEGYLTLTSIFGEDLLTAQVAERAQQLLQERITAYKIKRATDQLAFFEMRYNEKKLEYQQAQAKLANYQDRNLFVTTAVGESNETKLKNDYNLAYSVYTELAKQYENAKIKVKRVTPVYIIIKPVVVPNEPFAPKKTFILLVFIFMGFVLGSGIVLVRDFINVGKNKLEL
jgi:LPS O-antigen subunit length determinant protein (WzzB/FepE family)